ncbi:MAG: hypothetical protein AAB270_02030 [Chloroflexota bacterium]
MNSQELAATLQERFGGYGPLPHKFKIAVAGCPNSCAKPQENDLGIQGVAQLLKQGGIEGIAHLGSVEGDGGYGVFPLHQDQGWLHVASFAHSLS